MLVRAADEWGRAHGARRDAAQRADVRDGPLPRGGYVPVGNPYLEAGIEHVDMELVLG